MPCLERHLTSVAWEFGAPDAELGSGLELGCQVRTACPQLMYSLPLTPCPQLANKERPLTSVTALCPFPLQCPLLMNTKKKFYQAVIVYLSNSNLQMVLAVAVRSHVL